MSLGLHKLFLLLFDLELSIEILLLLFGRYDLINRNLKLPERHKGRHSPHPLPGNRSSEADALKQLLDKRILEHVKVVLLDRNDAEAFSGVAGDCGPIWSPRGPESLLEIREAVADGLHVLHDVGHVV